MTDIEKLKELETAATPGPWRPMQAISERWRGQGERDVWPNGSGYIKALMRAGDPERQFARFEDAEFCAAARNALPDLLASLASKDEEIELLRDAEARWIGRLSVVRETTGDAGKMMLSEFSTWFEKRWNELLAAETSLASKDAEIAELRDLADNAIEQIAVIRKGFEYEAQQKLLSLNNELHARAEAAESSLTTALAALGEARTWHQSEDKALSKSGRGDNDYYWRRAQHQEQIAELNATLAKLNALEGNEDE